MAKTASIQISVTDEQVRQVLARLILDDDKAFRVWRFHQAPAEYRALSRHGGDEDFVVVGPAGSSDADYIADRLTVCGCEQHTVGALDVYITAHA